MIIVDILRVLMPMTARLLGVSFLKTKYSIKQLACYSQDFPVNNL